MKNKTINALIEMGIPANAKGFKYIIDAICLFSEDEKLIHGKTMDLYQIIAEQNDDTISRVERALRHAFKIALSNKDLTLVNKYLSLQYKSSKALLATLYYRLKMEE